MIVTGVTDAAILRLAERFNGDTFKLALYTSSANLDTSTAAYTTAGEVSGGGYPAGGWALTNVTPVVVGRQLVVSFQTLTPGGSYTCQGAMIYNTSDSNRSVYVVDYGSSATRSTFAFGDVAAGEGVFSIRFV